MKPEKKKLITEEELQSAIKKFIQNGGIIRVLPKQKTVVNNTVGHKYSTSEIGSDIGS